MVRFAVLNVDFTVKVKLHMVVDVLGIGVAGESERGGLQVDLTRRGWNIGH